MDELCSRLEAAEERSVITQVIKEMMENAATPSSCLKYASASLHNLPKLRKFLTASEIESTFHSLLAINDPMVSVKFVDLCFQAKTSAHEVIVKIFELVCLQLHQILQSTLTNSEAQDSGFDFYNSLSIIVSLKDRLGNYFAVTGDSGEDYSHLCRTYDKSVKDAVSHSLERAFHSVSAGNDVNLVKISTFIGRGRNIMLENETFVRFVVQWFGSRDESPIWDRLAQRIFLDDTHGKKETASMISAVLVSVSNHSDLMRCLGYSIRSSILVRMQCKARIIAIPSPSLVIDAVVSYVAAAGGSELFQSFFEELVLEWSDKNAVKQMPDLQQKCLTKGILFMLHHGRKQDCLQHLRDVIFPIVVRGVQERLSNTDSMIRQSGMFVGESVSNMMTGVDPLKFEYDCDEWVEEMQLILQGNINEPSSSSHFKSLALKENVLLESNERFQKMQLDSDDEIDFPMYNIPESEIIVDLADNGSEEKSVCSRPTYIRDCLDRLDEKEKYEVFESGFLNLDSFIRRKGFGFDDIASTVIKKSIYLTNKFNTKDFEGVRRSCIVSCLAVKPDLCPDVINLAFARCSSMFHRYLILDCVLAAAKELSSPGTSDCKASPILDDSFEKLKLTECDNVVKQRVKSKTRYFGKQQKPVAVHLSRFSTVAPLFFYPLLTTSTGEHLDLRGEDSSFLSRVLFTAGEILTCASLSPSIVNMASTLTALISPLRVHDDRAVRAAAVFCFHAVCSSVPETILVDRFGEVAQTWVDWCAAVIENVHESEKNQQLAKLLLSTIVAKMGPSHIEC